MIQRDNENWLQDLRSPGPAQQDALAELRAVILRSLPYALAPYLKPVDPRFEPLAEETAQETLVRVLAHLDEFQGRSRFTTWACAIAVRVALTELRRKRWENVSLDDLLEAGQNAAPAAVGRSPENIVEGSDLARRLERILAEELTERQRQALLAMAVHGMPLEEIARRMGTNRNALYKLLHDARLRIKKRLEEEGITGDDVLAAFAG